MKITRTVEVAVSVSFEEACQIVLAEMDTEKCQDFERIVDKVLINRVKAFVPIPIVDTMKDEVLAKIKEEFSLEKIEQMYESNRKSN